MAAGKASNQPEQGDERGSFLRKYLRAAAAAAAISTPAFARDGSIYVGADFGLMKPQDTIMQTVVDFGGITGVRTNSQGFTVDYKTGVDGDVNAGYDFGMFRLEGEIAYKRAGVHDTRLDEVLLANLTNATAANPTLTNTNFNLRGNTHLSVLSGMVNAMLDFGDDDWGGFAGAGAGIANVHLFGDSSTKLALQGFAGLRHAITP
ncbi:MAG: P44/Msp2 family outer membrane protein, partial [Sphingomonas sp.]|nr:P44/Msp2 family outer membrane protein [Sphingomonas sp.]